MTKGLAAHPRPRKALNCRDSYQGNYQRCKARFCLKCDYREDRLGLVFRLVAVNITASLLSVQPVLRPCWGLKTRKSRNSARPAMRSKAASWLAGASVRREYGD